MDYKITSQNFNLCQTLFCGQCFRFTENNAVFSGVVSDKLIKLSQTDDGVVLHNIAEQDIPFWLNYFDMQTDYAALTDIFSCDETLNNACKYAPGIRLLRQEPFETLISFIISQNNNIPRITGIIDRLCFHFGESKDGYYSFPTAAALKNVTIDDLSPLRAGFRAKYITDAAEKVNSGEVDLAEIDCLDYSSAKTELIKIKGVGEKVADCVLLFGYHKLEAFPKDVWINKVIKKYYPLGLPECIKGYEGIAQQYLFHYIRNCVEH